MGYKFVKDADDGEIYILPDEKEALKKTPPFLSEDNFDKSLDIEESYERNIVIADLQKQLRQKDKQLKTATRSVITVDKKNLIVCFVVLGIILVLTVTIAASIINNNSSPHVALPEQNITAEISITVTEGSNVSDELVSDDTNSTSAKVYEEQNQNALKDILIGEIDEPIITLVRATMNIFLLCLSLKLFINLLKSVNR